AVWTRLGTDMARRASDHLMRSVIELGMLQPLRRIPSLCGLGLRCLAAPGPPFMALRAIALITDRLHDHSFHRSSKPPHDRLDPVSMAGFTVQPYRPGRTAQHPLEMVHMTERDSLGIASVHGPQYRDLRVRSIKTANGCYRLQSRAFGFQFRVTARAG